MKSYWHARFHITVFSEVLQLHLSSCNLFLIWIFWHCCGSKLYNQPLPDMATYILYDLIIFSFPIKFSVLYDYSTHNILQKYEFLLYLRVVNQHTKENIKMINIFSTYDRNENVKCYTLLHLRGVIFYGSVVKRCSLCSFYYEYIPKVLYF